MLNKVILMGRLTKEPELRHTQSDIPVASFTLAVDRGYSRRDDAQQQSVDFINIVTWRGTAEFVSKWFSKGQLVAVSGRIQCRTYNDREGNNHTAVEVVADEVFFAEGKRKNDSAATMPSENNSAGFAPNISEFGDIIGNDEECPF